MASLQDIPLACADEAAAAEFLETMRWGEEVCCPRCGDCDVYQMTSRTGERNHRFLWRCRGCDRQFTVRIGTVMQDSAIHLRHWVFVFWAASASKKGVSALQIRRQTGLSYKSALFMMHRVRWAMRDPNAEELDGDVNTNTVESFFAILKRGIYGVFHNVSKKHLHRYIHEFEFRWNTRRLSDIQRLQALVRAGEDKRLTYASLVG